MCVCVFWGPVGVFGPGQRQVCRLKPYKTSKQPQHTHTHTHAYTHFRFAINKQPMLDSAASSDVLQTLQTDTKSRLDFISKLRV